MAFRILTDSSCNLTEDMIDEFDLEVLPLTFMVDGEQHQSYLKGRKTDLRQFYTMMREGKTITTSLPKLGESEATIKGMLERGEDVLYIGFSSGLSGTFGAMNLLIDQLRTDYPKRKIMSIDSLAASGGQGMLVYLACRKMAQGATIEETAAYAEEIRDHICHWFTVDDLMFLFRGGRVSRTSAWAGTMLNIKPVLHVDNDGKLVPMEKMRGRKKAIKALLDHMEQTLSGPIDYPIFITHGDCIEDVEYLESLISEKYGNVEFVVNYVDPVIGAHSGPGTLALFYVGTEK